MKVALCLYGLVGGLSKWRGGIGSKDVDISRKILDIGAENYKKNLFDHADVDVFIHCWSKELEKEIIEAYSPVDYTIEVQKSFDIPAHVPGHDWRKHSHYSRWYSTKHVVELKKKHETENDFKYDLVMMGRFDHSMEKNIDLESLDAGKFYGMMWPRWFDSSGSPLPDKNFFPLVKSVGKERFLREYSKRFVGYPHNHEGLLDQWLCASSENMDRYSELFDLLGEYSLPNRCPVDSAGQISAHRQSIYHLQQLGFGEQISLILDLHEDYPLIRRKYFLSA